MQFTCFHSSAFALGLILSAASITEAQRPERDPVAPARDATIRRAPGDAPPVAAPPSVITPDLFEPNDVQGQRLLGPYPLYSGQSFGAQGNFHNLTDVDLYRFQTNDGRGSCIWPGSVESFRVTINFGNVPAGAQYQIALYEGSTLRSSQTMGGGFTSVEYNYSGTCGSNDEKTFDIEVTRVVGDPTANLYTLNISYTDSNP